MQLTQFTDYSLRALIYIALKEQGCNISDIASAYGISRNHLVKIIHNLATLGLIITTRGKKGGIKLAPKTIKMDIKSLILQLEPHFDLVPCFNPTKQNCCIAPACKLKGVLAKAQEAFLDALGGVLLGDIIESPGELIQLLKL